MDLSSPRPVARSLWPVPAPLAVPVLAARTAGVILAVWSPAITKATSPAGPSWPSIAGAAPYPRPAPAGGPVRPADGPGGVAISTGAWGWGPAPPSTGPPGTSRRHRHRPAGQRGPQPQAVRPRT